MFIENTVENALKEKVATAIAVSVVSKKEVIKRVTVGREEENGKEIDEKTLFDLASLTKVIFTAPLVLKFAEQGKLSLRDSLNTYLSGFPEDITILSLLLHVSGIAGYLPLYKTPPVGAPSECGEVVKEKITLSDAVNKIRLYGIKRKLFEEVEYSCMGYILLGAVLEKISGKTLQTLANEFFDSLMMKDTVFNPKAKNVAATEEVGGIRLKGVVHDENARALGGVSTNAGLFSNLKDLEAFVQMMLNFGKYGEKKVLTRYSVMQMLKVQTGHLVPQRTVGWLNGKYFSGAPDFACVKSIGHSGFTGTSLFLDFERKVGIIILTNRVYYGRANRKHIRLRRLISNAVYGELIG